MSGLPLEIYSRLSMLEFVLEVVVANQLARQPEHVSNSFKADLSSRRPRLPPKSGPIDVELIQEMDAQITAMLKRFAERVSERESEIRDKI